MSTKPRSRSRRKKLRIPVGKIVLIGVGLAAAGVAYICAGLPDISKLGEFKKAPSITVKAEDGTVLGTYGDIYGDYVPYDQLPPDLIHAVVATEDRNFFYHFGIDPMGMLRALFVDLRHRRMVQGGSTITQQLAKNVFLTNERTLKRKLQEMVLAIELEHHFTKKEILTIYMNRVYMGAGNYGVDAASHRYFGHSVRSLSLGESAILVGLLKAPSRYAPTSNPDLSEKRATQVLLNMQDAGYITAAQVKNARTTFDDEDAMYRDSHGFGAFYFTDWVVGQLPEYIGDAQQDVVVTTTLNTADQRAAEDAVSDVLNDKGKALRASQAALFSMSPDGAIRAMVGGRSYRASQFNRVTQALRQPGSSFKLFVYLAALEAGYTPGNQMEDKPINVGKWHPRDYTGKYKGVISLHEAFAESINSIAVQLAEAIGRSRVIDMAQRLGITTPMEADPSLALGTNEVTLYDMTKAYAHLAANGNSVYPYAIKRIETPNGHVLFERHPVGSGAVLSTQVVEMMNSMLMAVTTEGTGRAAQIGRPIAGKTGTTSEYKDAWFIGFVPQLVTGVWVGNDDTSPMKKVTGGSLPASIWHKYMGEALKGVAVADIPSQSGMMGAVGGFFNGIFGGSPTPPPPPQPGQVQPWQQPGQQGQMQIQVLPRVDVIPPAGESQVVVPPVPGGPSNVPMNAQMNNQVPEEEPTPAYNAPPSFWDKLTGDDDTIRTYPQPGDNRDQ